MIKPIIQYLSHKILSFFNLTIISNEFLFKLPGEHRLKQIPQVGTIIDVGVSDSGTPFLYRQFPNAFYICIDPLHESEHPIKNYLFKGQACFLNVALGASEGTTTIQVSKKKSRTSLLKRSIEDANSRAVQQREIRVTTLDEIMRSKKHGVKKLIKPILLKIDTEGYEFECLKGSVSTLQQIDFIIIEVQLKNNFCNTYKPSEVFSFLATQGFELFQILRAGTSTADFLFSRSKIT